MNKLTDNTLAKLLLITAMLFSFAATTVNADEDEGEAVVTDSRTADTPAIDTSELSEDAEVSVDSSDEF